MSDRDNRYSIPDDLPVPEDDGACDHLPGMAVPSIALRATVGPDIDLSALPGRIVVYCYPRTGSPGSPPSEAWNAIPGARGCTPESCAFRDHYGELRQLGTEVFGLSAQSTEDQREFAEREHMPFPILSDRELRLAGALQLPTFEFDETSLIKRLTLVIDDGRIKHIFYPVFPPDRHAEEVVAWLAENPVR